jgi:hypothetical protein
MYNVAEKIMTDYSILEIPTVLGPPLKLIDIIYNCPVCDFEIEMDMFVDDNSFISCDVCDHVTKFRIKKI